jgi:uncharacterized protein
MRKTLFKGMLMGVLITALGIGAYSSARYFHANRLLVNQDLDHGLRPIQVPADWIKSGKPVFLYNQYAQSSDGKYATGIWSCEGPSTFEWQFDSDETVHVLDGRVEIDYLGRHFVLEPGDTAFFQAETRALWHVPRYMRKSFTLHHPNLIVRFARRLLNSAGFGLI